MTPNTCATKFSNFDSNDVETDVNKDVKCQHFDEFALLVKDDSTLATEFSNPELNGAKKNSNSDNVHNIMS